MKTFPVKEHSLDATDQSLGRLASRVAVLLMGKHKVQYAPNVVSGDVVIVENLRKMKVTGKKLNQKIYRHHSQYPGGLKTILLKDLLKQDSKDVLRRAVYNMLPKNKLRKDMMKRLHIKA